MSIAEKLVTVAENIPKVYNAGYEKGKAEGSTDSYYDTFWDAFQQKGERTDYTSAFSKASGNWNEKFFKPKYDIKPTGAGMNNTFNGFVVTEGGCSDLGQILSDYGVVLDTSELTTLWCTFQGCQFTSIPHLDLTNCTYLNTSFYAAKYLVTIEKLTLSPTTTYTQVFWVCNSLKNVTIDGQIGKDFEFTNSTLTAESVKSVLTHLMNYSDTENEFVYKVSLNSNMWNILDLEGNTAPEGMTWKDYVTTIGWNY